MIRIEIVFVTNGEVIRAQRDFVAMPSKGDLIEGPGIGSVQHRVNGVEWTGMPASPVLVARPAA